MAKCGLRWHYGSDSSRDALALLKHRWQVFTCNLKFVNRVFNLSRKEREM
jgi:hypothetical protein